MMYGRSRSLSRAADLDMLETELARVLAHVTRMKLMRDERRKLPSSMEGSGNVESIAGGLQRLRSLLDNLQGAISQETMALGIHLDKSERKVVVAASADVTRRPSGRVLVSRSSSDQVAMAALQAAVESEDAASSAAAGAASPPLSSSSSAAVAPPLPSIAAVFEDELEPLRIRWCPSQLAAGENGESVASTLHPWERSALWWTAVVDSPMPIRSSGGGDASPRTRCWTWEVVAPNDGQFVAMFGVVNCADGVDAVVARANVYSTDMALAWKFWGTATVAQKLGLAVYGDLPGVKVVGRNGWGGVDVGDAIGFVFETGRRVGPSATLTVYHNGKAITPRVAITLGGDARKPLPEDTELYPFVSFNRPGSRAKISRDDPRLAGAAASSGSDPALRVVDPKHLLMGDEGAAARGYTL